MAIKVDRSRKGRRNTYKAPRRATQSATPAPASAATAKAGLRGILMDVLIALAAIAVLLGIGIGSLQLYSLATTSDFFATQYVDVQGNTRLSKEMVMRFAGLKLGDNSLAVSITRMEHALLSTPWVEAVSIKRHLPGGFEIQLRERMPSFWVLKDGTLYYANEAGEPIAQVESRNFLPLPTLKVEEGAQDELALLPMYSRDLQSGELPVEFSAISGLTISSEHGVELYLGERDLRLSIATGDWKKNMQRMRLTLADLARRKELGSVREVRVSDENVWVIMSGQRSQP